MKFDVREKEMLHIKSNRINGIRRKLTIDEGGENGCKHILTFCATQVLLQEEVFGPPRAI